MNAPSRRKSPRPELWLYGIHSVTAALSNEARICDQCLIQKDLKERHHHIHRLAQKKSCDITLVPRQQLTHHLPPMAVHQGVALRCLALREHDVASFFSHHPRATRLVMLDRVTDPHNVGAIMRSAYLFGWHGLVCCRADAPPQSAIVAKSSSGALEHMPIMRVTKLTDTIAQLGQRDFFCLALDGKSRQQLHDVTVPSHLALLLGAEGRGIHPQLHKLCDASAAVATHHPVMGLNVSNAAAIAFYQLQKK